MSAEYQSFDQPLSPSPLNQNKREFAKAAPRGRRKKPTIRDYDEITQSKFAPKPAVKRAASEADTDKENHEAKKAKIKSSAKKEEIQEFTLETTNPELETSDREVLVDIHFNISEGAEAPLTPKSAKVYEGASKEGYLYTGRRARTWSRIDDLGSEALDILKAGPEFLGSMCSHVEGKGSKGLAVESSKSVIFSHSSFTVSGQNVTLNRSFYPSTKTSDMRVLGIGKYSEISEQLSKLAAKVGNETIANSLWEIVRDEEPSYKFTEKERKLTSKLAFLLFGVESQRDNGAIIVNAMFLDLVQDGVLEMKDIENLPMSKIGAKGASRKLGSLAFEEIISRKKDPKLKSELMDDFLQKYYDIVVDWTFHKFKIKLDPKFHIDFITKCIYENFERWFGVKSQKEDSLISEVSSISSEDGEESASAAADTLTCLDEIWDEMEVYTIPGSDTETSSLSGTSSLDFTQED